MWRVCEFGIIAYIADVFLVMVNRMNIKILFAAACLSLPLSAAPLAAEPPRVEVIALSKGKAILRINGERHVLKAGGDAVGGARLIRASSKQAVLEINGEERVLSVGADISTRISQPQTQTARIPDRGGVYITNGQINGRSVSFLLDTGASSVAMNRPTAERLRIPYREHGKPGWASTASEVKKVWGVQLDSVTVGQITLRNIRAVVIDTEHGEEVLLGMSFLSRVKLTHDEGMVVLEAE